MECPFLFGEDLYSNFNLSIMAYIQKKNILYYMKEGWNPTGGHAEEFLNRPDDNKGRKYCLDTGINWTEVVSAYNGIEVVVSHRGTDLYGCPYFAGTSRGLSRGGFTYWTERTQSHPYWHFYTLTTSPDLTVQLAEFGNDPTVTLQLYKSSTDTFTKTLKIQGSGWQGSNSIQTSSPVSFPQVGREFNLCIFQGWWGYVNSQSDYTVGTHTAYKEFSIYGYDGTTRTPLFRGTPWKDDGGRGCLKDQVSGQLFYSLNSEYILEAYSS